MIDVAIALAIQAVQPGEALPSEFYGSYALLEATSKSCSNANPNKVTLAPNVFGFEGEKLSVLMVEKISDREWHIWVRARKDVSDRKVEEFHLSLGPPGERDIVIMSDEGAAEAILKYGNPVPDAGVFGLFKRCKEVVR